MEEEEEGADSQESGEGEASQHVWDQDEFCDVPAEDEDMGADGEVGKEQGLPKWVEGQLKNGIHKLMRTHMIRSADNFCLIEAPSRADGSDDSLYSSTLASSRYVTSTDTASYLKYSR